MKKNSICIKTNCIFICIIMFISTLTACSFQYVNSPSANEKSEVFMSSWNENSKVTQSIIEYVEDITNEASSDYIPIEDRIAVFDMDGTLISYVLPSYFDMELIFYRSFKDPSYIINEDLKSKALSCVSDISKGNYTSETGSNFKVLAEEIFSGMTFEEYDKYVKDFKENYVTSFENLKYKEAFYQPMVEVVDYLSANDFTIYLVTGTDRDEARALLDGIVNIPVNNIIGSTISVKASGQADENDSSYKFQESDSILRGSNVINKPANFSKITSIVQEIGKQPILAFGDSQGDYSMLNYALANNKYKSASYVVLHDDTQREYGTENGDPSIISSAQENNWNIISMKNDFDKVFLKETNKTKENINDALSSMEYLTYLPN